MSWTIAAALGAAIAGVMTTCGRRDPPPATLGNPAVSPNGLGVAFGLASGARGELMFYDLRTKSTHRIIETSGPIAGVAFASDGKSVLFSVGEGYKPGRALGHGQLYVVGLDGSNPHRLLTSSLSDVGPSLTPDGRTVLFVRSHRQRRRSMGGREWTDDDLYRTDLQGSAPKRLSHLVCKGLSRASTVADSNSLIFSFDRLDADAEVYAFDPPSETLRRLTNGPRYNVDPVVNRQGDTIVFVSDRARAYDYELWSMHVDGTGPRQITRLSRTCWNPEFFPDGRSLVFVVDYREIWRVDLDGSHLQRLL